jgi:hypothetical protein
MRATTVREILSAAESNEAGYGLYRGWGMHAEEADLEMILQHL